MHEKSIEFIDHWLTSALFQVGLQYSGYNQVRDANAIFENPLYEEKEKILLSPLIILYSHSMHA